MGNEILTFGSIETVKSKLDHHKTPIFWKM